MSNAHYIDNNFKYHAPTPEQVKVYEGLRDAGKQLAAHIMDVVPDSREQSLALTNLEQAIMWANAGIARNAV